MPLGERDPAIMYGRLVAQALGRGGHPGAVVIPVPNLGNAPPAYADPHNNVFTKRIALDNARTMEQMNITGNFIWILDASANTASLDVRFNTQQNTAFPVSLGLTLGGFRFNRIYVTNTAQAGHWVDLMYGVQEPGTNLWINNPSQAISTFTAVRPGTLSHGTVTVGAAAAQYLAANSNRYEIMIQIVTAARTINIGSDNSIVAGEGLQIATGQTAVISCTDAIWAIASAAGTVTRYLEIAT